MELGTEGGVWKRPRPVASWLGELRAGTRAGHLEGVACHPPRDAAGARGELQRRLGGSERDVPRLAGVHGVPTRRETEGPTQDGWTEKIGRA